MKKLLAWMVLGVCLCGCDKPMRGFVFQKRHESATTTYVMIGGLKDGGIMTPVENPERWILVVGDGERFREIGVPKEYWDKATNGQPMNFP